MGGDGRAIELRAIGHVRGGRAEPTDDRWGDVVAHLELDPAVVEPTATEGLGDFSHLDVVYLFHLVDETDVCTGARHPRGRADWPLVGILAQRGRERPNRLGVSTCRLLAADGLVLEVTGLDAVDGTPVLDIKPHLSEFDPRGEVRQPPWTREIMRNYW